MAAATAVGARHREGAERCGEQRRERPKQPAAAGPWVSAAGGIRDGGGGRGVVIL